MPFFFKVVMKDCHICQYYAHNVRTKHFKCFNLVFINIKEFFFVKVIKTSTKILNVVMACSTDVAFYKPSGLFHASSYCLIDEEIENLNKTVQ